MRRLADERASGRIKHNRRVIDNCPSLYTGSMFQPHLIAAAVAYFLQRTDETNCPGDSLLRMQVWRCGLTNHWHPTFHADNSFASTSALCNHKPPDTLQTHQKN